jgi:competence protein ComEC
VRGRTRRWLGRLVLVLGLVAPPTVPAQAPTATTTSGGIRPAAGGVALISFLDVGQGDAILIRSPEGRTALIDAGLDGKIVERIRECGVTSLDMVVVTHHHTDHYGGMDEAIEAFRPKYFLAAFTSHNTPMFVRLLRLVRDRNMTALASASSARKIQLGSVTLTVLPQPPENPKEENDNSIGIRVTHGALDVLLTGDSEEDERAWWMKTCPELLRDCEVLKLAHHGSHNGTDAAWLDLVRPRVAVASLGEGNSYGHPHAETLELLQRKGIPLLRTDQRGTITIRSDGRRWAVDRPSGSGGRGGDLVRNQPSSSSRSVSGSADRDPEVKVAESEGVKRGWTRRSGREATMSGGGFVAGETRQR